MLWTLSIMRNMFWDMIMASVGKWFVTFQRIIVPPSRWRTLQSFKTMGTAYPVIQYHIPEEWISQPHHCTPQNLQCPSSHPPPPEKKLFWKKDLPLSSGRMGNRQNLMWLVSMGPPRVGSLSPFYLPPKCCGLLSLIRWTVSKISFTTMTIFDHQNL